MADVPGELNKGDTLERHNSNNRKKFCKLLKQLERRLPVEPREETEAEEPETDSAEADMLAQ